MKNRYLAIGLGVGLLAASAPASAELGVNVQLGVHDHYRGHDRHPPRYGYYYGHRYPHRPWARYYRPVYYQPVVVSAPVYVPSPVVETPDYTAPALSGNYGSDLAGLHEKLYRLRALLQRQDQKGQLSQEQYNRFMNALDGIEHDEHARSYDRGGNLRQEDFVDLYRRADQVGDDIVVALGQ